MNLESVLVGEMGELSVQEGAPAPLGGVGELPVQQEAPSTTSPAGEEWEIINKPQVDHVIILDFEATCDQSDDAVSRIQQCDIHEIIEFPAVWHAAQNLDNVRGAARVAGEEIDFFREYVRPTEGAEPGSARQLSPFCTQLTGITQEQVDTASPLGDVLARFVAWLEERDLVSALLNGTAVLVAHGEWDLGDQLPREAARKLITLPPYLSSKYTDLKVVFSMAFPNNSGTSLRAMLEHLNLPLAGRLHSGLDDCRNFGRILGMLPSGVDLSPTHHRKETEGNGAVEQLRGRSSRRPGDWDCELCGAVTFGRRIQCFRCGAPRPASAGEPPTAQPPRERRPLDWDCPMCGAVVFASKAACFKCGAPSPHAQPVHTGMHTGSGSRGVCYDWQKGICVRGASCRFAHEENGNGAPQPRPRGVCYDWQKGICTRGDSCRFAHSEDPQGGGRGKSRGKGRGAGQDYGYGGYGGYGGGYGGYGGPGGGGYGGYPEGWGAFGGPPMQQMAPWMMQPGQQQGQQGQPPPPQQQMQGLPPQGQGFAGAPPQMMPPAQMMGGAPGGAAGGPLGGGYPPQMSAMMPMGGPMGGPMGAIPGGPLPGAMMPGGGPPGAAAGGGSPDSPPLAGAMGGLPMPQQLLPGAVLPPQQPQQQPPPPQQQPAAAAAGAAEAGVAE